MTDPLLEAAGVWRWYEGTGRHRRGGRVAALQDVTLAVREGERVGVVGASGAGKSTLLRLLLAVETPDAGEIYFRQRPVRPGRPAALRWLRRQVQLVPQDPYAALNPRFTVEESVREPLVCLGVDGDHRRRVHEVLDEVGLAPELANRRPAELSGGQRQRVALARALAPGPALLVGDEPVSALDPPVRLRVLELLRTVARRRGTALVFVSHDLAAVRHTCDRVVALQRGMVVEAGPVEAVFAAPRAEATRQLLAAVPRLPSAPDPDAAR